MNLFYIKSLKDAVWPLNTLLGRAALSSLTMPAADFVALSVFLHNVHLRSENSTGGVSTLPLFSCAGSHHCIEKKWVYSKTIHWFRMGFVHVTFNLVFDLKVSEPGR